MLGGWPFPRTHNLEELQRLGETADAAWPLKGLDLTELTPYTAQLRYDFEFIRQPSKRSIKVTVKDALSARARHRRNLGVGGYRKLVACIIASNVALHNRTR